VGVAGSHGHLSSSGHVLGYHGDSRSSLDRLEAEGSPATVDVADLLRQGYEVSSAPRNELVCELSLVVCVLDAAGVLSLFWFICLFTAVSSVAITSLEQMRPMFLRFPNSKSVQIFIWFWKIGMIDVTL